MIVYTSAMAGTPLGAVLTHANLLANARSTVEPRGNSADDDVLALLPFSHLFGLTVTGGAPLLAGGRVRTMDRFHPVRAVELLADGITEVVGVPAVFHSMLAAIERRGVDLHGSALRLCVCGGAALPVELQDRWADVTGVELRQGYGLTEAAPVCLFNRVDRPNVRGTLGVPFPGVDVAIMSARRLLRRPSATPATRRDSAMASRARSACAATTSRPATSANRRRSPAPRRAGSAPATTASATPTARSASSDSSSRCSRATASTSIRARSSASSLELPGVSSAEVWPIPEPAKENDIGLRVTGSVTEDEVRAWCEDEAERVQAAERGGDRRVVQRSGDRPITLPRARPFADQREPSALDRRHHRLHDAGSNCVPLQRTISAIASSIDSAGR